MKTKVNESRLVATARKKLEKQLNAEKQHFNQASFQRAAEIIRASMKRHQGNSLKKREVKIVTSPVSREIRNLQNLLQMG